MKKKGLLALIMVLIIGFIPIIFAACGGKTENNISLGLVSGMDTTENNIPVIYLSADDEENSSRDLIFEIKNYKENAGFFVDFSTDSSAVEISEPTYYQNGKVKITVSANHGGSALVTATTTTFSHQTNFLVKVSEKIQDFNVKSTISTIYFEKGSELKLDIEKYFDFTPASTTERELKAYIGDELISNDQGEIILTNIEEDTEIVFVSDKLECERKLTVKVIESLTAEQITFDKIVYNNNGESKYESVLSGETIQVLKGGKVLTDGSEIDYSERIVRLIVNNPQENLKLTTKIQIKENGEWKTNNMIVADVVSPFTYDEESGTYVALFKFSYDGYDQMKVVFNYSVFDYVYDEQNEIYIECVQAPNNISINKNSKSEQEIAIYGKSERYSGKELNISAYPLNTVPYTMYLSEVSENINILDKNNSIKAFDEEKRIAIKNNETIKVLAKDETNNSGVFYVNLEYTFEGVKFSLQTKIDVNIKHSPSEIILSQESGKDGGLVGAVNSIKKYVFDLNTNEIIGETGNKVANLGKYSLTLYLYANVGGELQSDHGFIISNNLGIVEVKRGENNQINITAKSIGAGVFRIILDNGISMEFQVEVIESLSKLSLSLPSPSQNSNIYSILGGTGEYLFKVVALTGAPIPPIIRKEGTLISYTVACDNAEFKDGYIIGKKDSDKFDDCIFTFKYYYVNENNEKKIQDVELKFQIMFFTQILDFSLSTNKGSTNFDLYDYSSVGFYSEELATAVISVNISPDGLKSDLIDKIIWRTNIVEELNTITSANSSITTYYCDIFTFVFDSKTGVGVLRCEVIEDEDEKERYFDENGNFIPGKIVLSASIERENNDQELENMTKSVQFNVLKNIPIEQIVASVDSISIDQFKGDMAIYTTTYPVNASNKNLRAVFVPDSLQYQNAIQFEWRENGQLIVKLQEGQNTGKGVIRLIAVDSYTESDKFTTYLDIPLVICDGSEEYPYQIISENDLSILIETNFEKHYQIVGELDISKFVYEEDVLNEDDEIIHRKDALIWEYSTYELTGSITGINNASIIGINPTYLEVETGYTKEVVCGLFKSIGKDAKITNIKFKGGIGLTLNNDENSYLTKIGLIAGESHGTLQNVYVELDGSNITASGGYKISFGGMVGENYGYIISTINDDMMLGNLKLNYTRLVEAKIVFTDNSTTANATHTLYFGGVAGANYGLIKCDNTSTKAEINNSFTTVNVDFELKYVKAENEEKIRGHISGDKEAIGAVAGLTKELFGGASPAKVGTVGIQAMGRITAGVYENNKFIGHFNNVGGLVGNNSTEMKDCVSKVKISGRENVGGAVGKNDGGDLNCIKVQALEEYDNTLIVGNNNVGGLVGEITNGAIARSTFISYVSKTSGSDNAGDIVVYDIVVYDISLSLISNVKIGRLIASASETTSFEYCVAIANVKFEGLEIEGQTTEADLFIKSQTNGVAISQTNGVAIFGKDIGITDKEEANDNNAVDPNFLKNLTGLEKIDEEENEIYLTPVSTLDNFIAKIVAYEEWAKAKDIKVETSFIILAPTEISKSLTDLGETQQLVDVNGGTETVFYLILHQKEDGSLFDNNNVNNPTVWDYINVKANSNTGIVLTSSDENILKIEGEQFKLAGAGLVKITATSQFNKKLSAEFYVYVVRNMNDFSAYRTADRISSQITNNTTEVLDAETSYMIYFKYLYRYDPNNYFETDQVLVAIKIGETIIWADGAINETYGVRFARISSEAYQLTITDLTDYRDISFVYYLETTIKTTNGDEVYRTEIGKTINDVDIINFKYKVINETKSITVSDPEIVVLPYYSPIIDVNLVSKNASEVITILTYLERDGAYINIDNDTTLRDLLGIYVNGKVYDTEFRYDASGDIKTFQIKFELNDKTITTAHNFKVVIKTSNKLEAVVYLTYNPQLPNDITVELYPENDETNADGSVSIPSNEKYTYISTNKIIPGPNTSLLHFIIVPGYSDYDYVLIKNLSTNEYKIVFELYDRQNNNMILGAQDTEGGIIVPKNIIEDGMFYLRAFIDSRITDLTTVGITVDIMKSGESGNDISLKSTTKTLYVEHLPGVRLEIDGKDSSSDDLKLALGVEYPMGVMVKGYESGELILDYKTKTYKDGELRFKLNDLSLAKIEKNSDGTYKIIPSTNGILTITTYGEKLTPTGVKTSKTDTITIEIVNFVVKLSPSGEIIGDIIKGVNNGVHHSAVGNQFVFEATLNDEMLVYNRANSQIVEMVEKFLTDLTISSESWYVKDVKEVYMGFSHLTLENFAKYAELEGVKNAFKMSVENEKIIFTFTATQDEETPSLIFKFKNSFHYNDGTPTVGNDDNGKGQPLIQEFIFDITEKTNIRNPRPIYSDEDLLDMVEGNYYILMNDIQLPAEFTPITTLIGGLDGNNYKIQLPTNLDYDNPAGNLQFNFGLFERIAEGALIANIQLYIPSEVSITLSTYDSVLVGLLAAENRGTITNCSVLGGTYAHVSVATKDVANETDISTNILAGLVGVNYGSITNSRVWCSLTSSGNMAGVVYQNFGTIASSYFNGSVINNTTSTASKTAGFVGINDFNGYIFSSYITGDYENINDQFATSMSKLVYTKHTVGAFVHSNNGTISNCYANIPVSGSSSYASGFVYLNEKNGLVEYSYSTSKMDNNRTSHTAFVGRTAEGLLNRGTLVECYAFSVEIDNDESTHGFNYNLGLNSNINGLTIFYNSQDDFSNQNNFEKFAFSTDEKKTNGVWFFPTSATEKAYQYDGKYLVLKPGRPELVSPNIIVDINTHKKFTGTTISEETGETIYHYDEYEEGSEKIGSMYNPIIISSVDDMELIAEGAKTTIGEEDYYYRLTNDIIYQTGTTSSVLYKYYFLGNLEGNSFTIGNYVIDSSESMESAGFFAGVGSKLRQNGSIKNATFAPRYINLPNTNSVGAVAGSIYGGNVVNVKIDGFEYDFEGLVILGKNTVGAVAGYITGNYIVNNVSSNVSVNATYRASLNKKGVSIYDGGNLAEISHSGSVFGVVDGKGRLDYISAYGDIVVLGECVGLLFGYVGNDIVTSELTATASGKQSIKADVFAGVIAGVSSGILQNIEIKDNSLSKNSFFAEAIYKPIAVGNIVGYMVGGEISNANVKTTTYVSTDITAVGGAVGAMRNGTLYNVVVSGDISAGSMVGGLVGYVGEIKPNGFNASPQFIRFNHNSDQITFINSYLVGNITSNSTDANVYVGTMVGTIKVEIVDSSTIFNKFKLQFATELPNVNLIINNYRNSKVVVAFGIYTLNDITTNKLYSGIKYKFANDGTYSAVNYGAEIQADEKTGKLVVSQQAYLISGDELNEVKAELYPQFKITYYERDASNSRIEYTEKTEYAVIGEYYTFPTFEEAFTKTGYIVDDCVSVVKNADGTTTEISYDKLPEYNAGKFEITQDWDFRIKWKPITYYIKYKYDGKEIVKEVEYDNSKKETFLACLVDGLKNIGWEFNGKKYAVGSEIPNLTSEQGKTINLEAIFQQDGKCAITLDAVDGKGSLDGYSNLLDGLCVGDKITELPEPTSSYYSFQHWILDGDEDLKYDAGENLNIEIVSENEGSAENTAIQFGDHTLTAVYTPNISNITIKVNNDSYGTLSQGMTNGLSEIYIGNVFVKDVLDQNKSDSSVLKLKVYEQEDEITISATSKNEGQYTFVNWTYDESNNTITANFKVVSYKIDLTISTSGLNYKQYLTIVSITADEEDLVKRDIKRENSDSDYKLDGEREFSYGTVVEIKVKTVIPTNLLSIRLTCEWNIVGGTLDEASHTGRTSNDADHGKYANALYEESGSGTANGYITQSYRLAGQPQREVTITIRVELTSETTINIAAYERTFDGTCNGQFD